MDTVISFVALIFLENVALRIAAIVNECWYQSVSDSTAMFFNFHYRFTRLDAFLSVV